MIKKNIFIIDDYGEEVRIYVEDKNGHHVGFWMKKTTFIKIVKPIIKQNITTHST